MKRWLYAVTFEAPETKPPETLRGEVLAGSPGRACTIAVREASKARTGRTWDSLVVLLEKAQTAAAAKDEAA